MSQIVQYSKTEAALADLRQSYNRAYEVSTTKGMEEAKAARAVIRTHRTDLEKMRKELKEPLLDQARAIDAEAKRITAELLAIEEPIDQQIKAEEERKEQEKLAKAEAAAESIRQANLLRNSLADMVVKAAGQPASAIASIIEHVGRSFLIPQGEHAAALQQQKDETIERLEVMHQQALAIAEERAEIARLRAKAEADAKTERERIATEEAAAMAKREQADREAAAAREAADRQARITREDEERRMSAERERIEAEQAKLKAERDAKDAQERTEREAAEAKARAERDAAEAKERERLAAEARKMDAHAMLQEFIRRFGTMPEFAAVVAAIESLPSQPKQKKGK